MVILPILLGLVVGAQSHAHTISDLVYDYVGYNNGSYGPSPNRTYLSSNLTSPLWQVNEWVPEQIDQSARHIFLSLAEPGEMSGPKIFSTKDLSLVYSAEVGQGSSNVRMQRYRGEDYLTYWAGAGTGDGSGSGACYFLNSTYDKVFTITPIGLGSNTTTDPHECQMTENNTVLISVFRPRPDYDLTSIGGPSNGTLKDSGFQEIDIATNTSLFTWWASDHFNVSDTYATYTNSSHSGGFDFFHLNSAQKVGNDFIVSGRFCSLVTYVSHTDGEPIWILGGKLNQFQDLSQGKALSFSLQHHVRIRDPNMTGVTMFDNHGAVGAVGCETNCSRGLRLQLDTGAMTVRVVAEVYHPQSLATAAEGSWQPQSNENTLVGWGLNPTFTETTASGETVWDVQYGCWSDITTMGTYRVFKDSWVAYPRWDPSIVVQAGEVYVSWNGATEVEFWDLYTGDSTNALSRSQRVAKSGFETSIRVNGTKGFVQVKGIDKDNEILGTTEILTLHNSSLVTGWSARKFVGLRRTYKGSIGAGADLTVVRSIAIAPDASSP